MSAPAVEATTSAPFPPYVIEIEGPDPHGFQEVLVDAAGRLLGEPLRRVGQFTPDGRGALIAPAQDLLGRCGFLDQQGRWLSEPGFGWHFMDVADGLMRIRTDDGWGFLDLRGEVVVEPRFEVARPFANGLAVVRLADGFGYIDRTGELVAAGPFHTARPFSAVGLAAVQLTEGGGFGFVDTTGALVIPPRYEEAKGFSPAGAAPVRTGGEWGLIDTRGAWIDKPRYFRIGDFTEDGLAYFRGPSPLTTGYLDSAGRAVITVEAELSERPRCGLIKHRSKEDVGFLHLDGTPALGARFAWADDFHARGAAIALSHDAQWGVLRTDGEFLPVDHHGPLIDEAHTAFGFTEGRGLARFMARDGSVVCVDPYGRDLCELEVGEDGLVLRSLTDTAGTEFRWLDDGGSEGDDSDDDDGDDEDWDESEQFEPLFTSGPPEHCTDVPLWEDDIVKLVQWLIDSEPRRFLPTTMFDTRTDCYDLDGLDEFDLEQVRCGELFVLASTYIGEGEWDEGETSGDDYSGYFDDFVKLLSAHYGEPAHGEEGLGSSESEQVAHWQVGDSRLVLQTYRNYGDGDIENQLWLAAVLP